MGLTEHIVADAVRRARDGALASEQELNAADGRLGDGDTGVTLRRVFERLSGEAAEGGGDDIGAYFRALGAAASGASGSSLGTLIALALMTIGKQSQGESEIAWRDLGGRLAAARDVMLARGGAALGDKTVVDALDAVVEAVRGMDDPGEMRTAALAAADTALADFRDRPCRMGRARMFRDKSVGIDDPGMLAFVRLLRAVLSVDTDDNR